MKQNREKRLATVEFRAVENEEGKMIITGYPITFNAPATHFGFTEIIDPEALKECDLSDVPLRIIRIFHTSRNSSLQLEVDNIGLKMTAELIDTNSNKDIYKSIMAGLLDKMSFGFTPAEEQYDHETDTRRILKIDKLWDVSVVDVPYYDTTSVYARKLDTSKDYSDQVKEEKKKIIVR